MVIDSGTVCVIQVYMYWYCGRCITKTTHTCEQKDSVRRSQTKVFKDILFVWNCRLWVPKLVVHFNRCYGKHNSMRSYSAPQLACQSINHITPALSYRFGIFRWCIVCVLDPGCRDLCGLRHWGDPGLSLEGMSFTYRYYSSLQATVNRYFRLVGFDVY